MEIRAPQGLSRCDNRTHKAKGSLQTGRPEDWFTISSLAQLEYNAFSFDFLSIGKIVILLRFWRTCSSAKHFFKNRFTDASGD